MSNNLIRASREGCFVLVRGSDGEAKKLLAGPRRGQLTEVVSLDKSASICIPAVDVFDFDQGLFRKLTQAYRNHDTDSVQSLWTLGKRYKGASNGE